jgi:hypothetical protein
MQSSQQLKSNFGLDPIPVIPSGDISWMSPPKKSDENIDEQLNIDPTLTVAAGVC